MAGENERQANVVLTADTTNYSQQMTSAAQQTNAVTDSVNKLITQLDRLTKFTGRRLEIVSATTVAGITAATLAAGRFEQQLSTLQATSAITGQNMSKVTQTVDSLRRSLPVSTEQVVALVTALQKMGATNSNVESLARTFVKLSAVTGEDLGSLAASMVQLQRQMGTSSGSTEKFANSVAELSARLGVSATGLLQFANSLAPVARQMGMTQTEVMGFAAAFQRAGQDGFAAANVFNKLLTDISRATRYGSNDIYAYANAVGMTAEAFKALPAADQAAAFFNAINKQGPDAIKTLERLGYDGPRSIKAIQGLVQSGGLSQALGTAQQGFNGNALEKGAKAAMDGLNDALQELRNNLTSIAQVFGSTFLPMLTKAVEGLSGLAGGVRAAMGPFNALLGMLGVGGGTVTGLAGFALSNFSTMAAVGGALALMRNPLTAGIAAARGGSRSSMLNRAAARFGAGEGSAMQQRMFGWGQTMGGFLPRYQENAGARGILGRVAMGASGLMQTGMGIVRSGIDPLRWTAATNMVNRSRFQMNEGRAAFRSAFTGEGASLRNAVTGVATGMARFGAATASATAGLTRLGAAAATSALRAAGGGLMGAGAAVGRGIGGLLGALGPVGIGLLGGSALFSYIGSERSKGADFRDRMLMGESSESAVNKYAASLGLASTAAMSFAQTLTNAEKKISGEITTEGATQVTTADIRLANQGGRSLTNANLSGMNAAQATQYATSVFALPGIDPQIQQAMKLDLIQQFGASGAEKIIAGAQQRRFNSTTLLGDQTQNDTSMFALQGMFSARGGLTSSLNNVVDTYKNANSGIFTSFGSKESNKYTVATINSLLGLYDQAGGAADQARIASSIEGVLGGQIGIDYGDQMRMAGAETPRQRQLMLQSIIKRSLENGGSTGRGYLEAYQGLTTEQQNATSYQAPIFGGQADMYAQLGVYGTRAGRMVSSGAASGAIQAGLTSPDSANLQLAAAQQWAQELMKSEGSLSATTLALQAMQGKINDTGDYLYEMGVAAQTAAQRLQGYQSAYQSSGTNARDIAAGLGAAYRSPNFPGREEAIINAEDAYENARSGLFNQFKTIVKAYREFDISQARAAEDFAKQRSRSDYNFYLQKKYAEVDYNTNRARGEQDYNTQRARGEKAYWLQRQYSQEDFDRSRRRAEEDFNHQVEQMARQQARSISNIYQMIVTQPTWDAQNLLTNSNDQLARMRQQQQDLATARGMGLSGDVISQLGLNEFSNQQQLARMVSDLASNPQLVAEWNKAIEGRLDIAKAFVTDNDSDAWKEMRRQFKLASDRAVEDFNLMVTRGADAYQLGLDHMAEDYTKMTERADADYRKMVKRQNEAYALSVAQTVADWNTQMVRAKEDLNRSFEEITGTFEELEKQALGRLSGTTAAQMSQLARALGMSREEVKKAAEGTAEDLLNALAPLFGGREAAMKALGITAKSSGFTSPSVEWNMNKGKGGPHGSEQSYDSASGAHGGPALGGGVTFPLPAGSYSKTSGFGMRRNPVSGVYKLHAGNDYGARPGTPIGAAADGMVTKAQVLGGLGNMVEVTHGGGNKTWYGHMSSIAAKVGQMVTGGTMIGRVGSTGNSTGPHLHFELHVNGKAIDPSSYLSGAGFGDISGGAGGFMQQSKALDMSNNPHLKDVETGLRGMPGGSAYRPGLVTTALQRNLNLLAGMPQDDGTWFGHGGIFNQPRRIGVGERGAEMLIPLDTRGADFLAQTMAKFAAPREQFIKGGQTVQPQHITYQQHYDQHTEYTGDITVQAADPREFERSMAERQRMKALTRPGRKS